MLEIIDGLIVNMLRTMILNFIPSVHCFNKYTGKYAYKHNLDIHKPEISEWQNPKTLIGHKSWGGLLLFSY